MDNIQVIWDKDGLPTNEKGEYICYMDKEGNVHYSFTNQETVVFHPHDKNQVNFAARKIAKFLTAGFIENIDSYGIITFSEQGIKHLNAVGLTYQGRGVKIPRVNMYFDGVNKKLNYFGVLHGSDFEYLMYVYYKEALMNEYLFVESGLGQNKVPENHIKFAKLWFEEKDKIYAQKMELLNKSKSDSNSNENINIQDERKNPYPQIFINFKTYELFKHWQNQVSERTQLAEYSFIYWAMLKDGFIYKNIKSKDFIEFLNDKFEIALSELKQYNNCKGGGKESKYSTAKLLFK